MLRPLEEPPGVFEADHPVGGRVEDQQRPLEPFEDTPEMILRQIVQQLAADAERASSELDLGLAARLEVRSESDELLFQLPGVAGRGDRRDRADLRDPRRRRQRGETPRLCPTSSRGASRSRRRKSAAATRSSKLEEKSVPAKSPSLSPVPVKSNRSTAIPRPTKARLIQPAAFRSLEQVKQWAKRA